MKKIMVLTVAAVAACVANASSVNWKFSSANTYAGYDVYLVTELANGGFKDVADVQNHALGSSGNTGEITAGRTAATASGTAKGLTAAEGDTVNFYYVIVNPNDASNAGYWTMASSATAYETSATHTDSSIGSSAANALLATTPTAWAGGTPDPGPTPGPDPIPEPTSGLLLLVGGAMLALRRK